MSVLAAQVWHFWLAVPLAVGTVVMVVATVGGYLKQVSAQRYPPESSRPKE